MDDRQAFEQRVAGEVVRGMGPSEPVDDLAIFNYITAATRSPKWRFPSMFSATKFVVAGAIVALFGGFLLSSVLTQPSEEAPAAGSSASVSPESPPTAEASVDLETSLFVDLVPGVDLVTEEIEPGVVAVLRDRAGHDLRRLERVEVTSDGSVWITSAVDPADESRARGWTLFRLGHGGGHKVDFGQFGPLVASLPDGSLVILSGRGVYRVDPETAAKGTTAVAKQDRLGAPGPDLPKSATKGIWGTAISAAADGSVWASWTKGCCMNADDTLIVRYDGTGWEDLSGTDGLGALIDLTRNGNYVCDIENGTAGDTWVGVCGGGGRGFGAGGLFRHDGSGWEAVTVFDDIGRPDVFVSDAASLATGADGTMWAMVFTQSQERLGALTAAAEAGDLSSFEEQVDDPLLGSALIRYRDGRWSAFPLRSESPEQDVLIIQSFGAVDDHGVLWFGTGDREQSPRDAQVRGADVLASFDGEIVRRYPAVTDIEDLTFDAEGRLWVVGGSGLYVIDPEAVAVTEQ